MLSKYGCLGSRMLLIWRKPFQKKNAIRSNLNGKVVNVFVCLLTFDFRESEELKHEVEALKQRIVTLEQNVAEVRIFHSRNTI